MSLETDLPGKIKSDLMSLYSTEKKPNQRNIKGALSSPL